MKERKRQRTLPSYALACSATALYFTSPIQWQKHNCVAFKINFLLAGLDRLPHDLYFSIRFFILDIFEFFFSIFFLFYHGKFDKHGRDEGGKLLTNNFISFKF